MKKAIIRTTVVAAMLCITIHFCQSLASARQSYLLMQTVPYPEQIVQPPWF